jgi:guanylate kinase
MHDHPRKVCIFTIVQVEMPKSMIVEHVSGIALSGRLGVGKSTIAKSLLAQLPLRQIRSVVTRQVEDGDAESIHMPEGVFVRECQSGNIVMPYHFASNWYGYAREDWDAVVSSGGLGFLFNVRPYAGLLLGTMHAKVIPVWLTLPEETRQARLQARGALRDHSSQRVELDAYDAAYATMFRHSADTTDTARCIEVIKTILTIRDL